MDFHRSSSDSKSDQVSRTFLRILAGLTNVIVLNASVFHLISKPSGPITNLLGIVPSTPVETVITMSFMFYIFFSSLGTYLIFPFILILLFGLTREKNLLFV